MNKDYIDGYMEGHSEGMAAGFNLLERTGTQTRKCSDKPEPREFWVEIDPRHPFMKATEQKVMNFGFLEHGEVLHSSPTPGRIVIRAREVIE